MAYNYDAAPEEQDDGYSIPKILVAVLILVLIGAGIYIYLQQKKLDTSITYLLNSKKEAEQDLNEMIEKYNLAIEESESLEGNLLSERDRIIKYRDSIKNIKNEDLKEDTDFKKTISDLKKRSSVQTVNIQPISNTSLTKIQVNTDNSTPTDKEIFSDDNTKDPQKANETTISETETKKPDNTDKTNAVKSIEAAVPVKTSTTFKRVEMPPTFPGCKGTAEEKRTCFETRVKKHLARKFNSSVIDNLDLERGVKKIWINFDIDKHGNVINVTARSPKNMSVRAKKKVESEAIRAIKKMPKMKPAIQNGKSVDINYTVPLVIMIE